MSAGSYPPYGVGEIFVPHTFYIEFQYAESVFHYGPYAKDRYDGPYAYLGAHESSKEQDSTLKYASDKTDGKS